MPNLVTYPNRSPTFEWYMVWHGSKNGYQKHMCYKKQIRLHAQNMITIILTINITREGLYDHLMNMGIFFSMIMNFILLVEATRNISIETTMYMWWIIYVSCSDRLFNFKGMEQS